MLGLVLALGALDSLGSMDAPEPACSSLSDSVRVELRALEQDLASINQKDWAGGSRVKSHSFRHNRRKDKALQPAHPRLELQHSSSVLPAQELGRPLSRWVDRPALELKPELPRWQGS